MKKTYPRNHTFILIPSFILTLLVLLHSKSYAQPCAGSNISLRYFDFVQTAPDTVEFDIEYLNTGTTILSLGACAGGFVYNAAALNGGTLTAKATKYSYVSILNNLNASGNLTVQAATSQVRWAHTPISGTSVLMSGPGASAVWHKTYHIKLYNSVPFSTCVPLILTPNYGLGTSYSNNIATTYCNGNNSSSSLSSAQPGTMVPPTPIVFSNTSYVCPTMAATSNIINAICYTGMGSATITLSASLPLNTTFGKYIVDGDSTFYYTTNPFTIPNLSQGTHDILIQDTISSCCTPFNLVLSIGGPSPPTANIDSQTACGSYTWPANGLTYTNSGAYGTTGIDSQGCPTIDSLYLTITSSISNVTQITACDEYTWLVNNQVYSSSGTYVYTNGCNIDSLILTISTGSITTDSINVCGDYLWSVNNQVYTTSGVYTDTFQNSNGCDSIHILNLTINALPTITANDSTICQGQFPVFNASGGSNYNFIVNGNSVQNGTDSFLNYFSIANNDSVYVMTNNDSSCISAQIQIIVNPYPTINVQAIPSSVCLGGSINLTPYGSLTSNTYTWTKNYIDYYPVSVSDVPSSTAQQIYSILAVDANGCSMYNSVFVNVTIPSGNLSQSSNGNNLSVSGSNTNSFLQPDGMSIIYFDTSCNIIASILDSTGGTNLALTEARVDVDTAINTWNSQPYVRRHYQITPSNQGISNVTLYLTQGDFDDYNVYALANNWPLLPTSSSDLSGIANLRITKLSGGGLGVGSPSVITPTLIWNSNSNYWEASFSISTFSEFYFHAANPVNAPLPLQFISFTGKIENSYNTLFWTTTNEVNNSYFIIERSEDGVQFNTLEKVNSKAINGNSHSEINYTYIDKNPKAATQYYRLESIDMDGKKSSSKQTVILKRTNMNNAYTIYPNPTNGILHIDFNTDKSSNMIIKLMDITGRLIYQVQTNSTKGFNQLLVETNKISNGLYILELVENGKSILNTHIQKQN